MPRVIKQIKHPTLDIEIWQLQHGAKSDWLDDKSSIDYSIVVADIDNLNLQEVRELGQWLISQANELMTPEEKKLAATNKSDEKAITDNNYLKELQIRRSDVEFYNWVNRSVVNNEIRYENTTGLYWIKNGRGDELSYSIGMLYQYYKDINK